MKSTFLTILVTAALLVGCTDSPLSPPDSPQGQDNHSYKLIKLPPKSGFSVETTFSVSELIDGEKGGDIKIKEEYIAADGHKVKIEGKLHIKKDAFVGTQLITFKIDDEFAAAEFSPGMTFDVPLELDLKFEGMDLSALALEEGDYDFVYIGDDGHIETIQNNGLHVKEDKGKIWVNKAELNHFSRYAFSR